MNLARLQTSVAKERKKRDVEVRLMTSKGPRLDRVDRYTGGGEKRSRTVGFMIGDIASDMAGGVTGGIVGDIAGEIAGGVAGGIVGGLVFCNLYLVPGILETHDFLADT